jgi:hypothetical protein
MGEKTVLRIRTVEEPTVVEVLLPVVITGESSGVKPLLPVGKVEYSTEVVAWLLGEIVGKTADIELLLPGEVVDKSMRVELLLSGGKMVEPVGAEAWLSVRTCVALPEETGMLASPLVGEELKTLIVTVEVEPLLSVRAVVKLIEAEPEEVD